MHAHNNRVAEIQPTKDNDLKAINDYLKIQPATATAVAVALNIYRPSLCRRKRTLEKLGYLSVIKKVKCPITKKLTWLLTTNPDLFPTPSQLNIF